MPMSQNVGLFLIYFDGGGGDGDGSGVESFPFLAADHLLFDVFRHFGFSHLAFLLLDFFLVVLLGRSAMWLLEWGLKLSEEE